MPDGVLYCRLTCPMGYSVEHCTPGVTNTWVMCVHAQGVRVPPGVHGIGDPPNRGLTAMDNSCSFVYPRGYTHIAYDVRSNPSVQSCTPGGIQT